MRSFRLFVLTAILAVPPLAAWGIETATAPSNPGDTEVARRAEMIGFLPQAEQDRVMAAYNKAVAADPQLQAERASLKAEWNHRNETDTSWRHSYSERVRMFQQKLRAAMLKQDATLGPVLDKIDKHRSEMRAKHPDQW